MPRDLVLDNKANNMRFTRWSYPIVTEVCVSAVSEADNMIFITDTMPIVTEVCI